MGFEENVREIMSFFKVGLAPPPASSLSENERAAR